LVADLLAADCLCIVLLDLDLLLAAVLHTEHP
jgi:hypothetical protein